MTLRPAHGERPQKAPSSILRLRSVLQRTGLTRPTLYRKIADGTFPRQVRISTNGVGWREDEVDVWLRDPAAYGRKAR